MCRWWKRRRKAPAGPGPFMHLAPGQRCRVVCAFVDHDGIVHPVGETLRFLRSDFLPYENGLSLFVAMPGGAERQIRLQWRPEAEGPVIDALDQYVLPVSDGPGDHALLLTRDSVGLADDVRSPHHFLLEIAGDADAVMAAEAILAAGYPARWGRHPIWAFDCAGGRILLGYRDDRPFVEAHGSPPPAGWASEVDHLHLTRLGGIA